MRALTLIRPWDQAILHGGKRVENRTWMPHASLVAVGDRFAIHAGQKFNEEAADFIHAAAPHITPLLEDDIGRGGVVVGVATLVGLHRGPRECCDICRGQWAMPNACRWLLSEVVALPEPVPCRGAQGLWMLPPAVEVAVRSQIKSAA